MAYKVKNLTKETRKFRIHKTAEGFLIRPGEELTVPYPLIINRPEIFEVTNLDEVDMDKVHTEKEILEVTSKRKRTKKGDNK
ncbi:hypothetical protein DRN69_05135 [Candidatus Pacearchaeota archaeon]|nr:MAG: hypothetical protein DRN69_05135 [Candidatus Pacearchaeota archaeon]